MDATTTDCPLAVTLAGRLREQRDILTSRWLLRIADRVSLTPNRIFPSDDLIDHVPLLLLGIADYIEDPARPVLAETPVIAKAMELGALRHTQGFDEHQLQAVIDLGLVEYRVEKVMSDPKMMDETESVGIFELTKLGKATHDDLAGP